METKTELSKQGRRMERKKRKMEALLRLDASHQTEKQMTDHEKVCSTTSTTLVSTKWVYWCQSFVHDKKSFDPF